MSLTEVSLNIPAEHIANIFGQFDAHIRKIERALKVTLVVRGESVKLLGDERGVKNASGVFSQLLELAKRGNMITEQNVDYALALVAEGKEYDVCIAIGPMIMMKFVCLLTKELNIPTVVSLNPIMVDGTGMCGACRVTVDGKVKFACVDGPEFDGHAVNFDEAMRRQTLYKTEEGRAMLQLQEGDTHHGGCGNC